MSHDELRNHRQCRNNRYRNHDVDSYCDAIEFVVLQRCAVSSLPSTIQRPTKRRTGDRLATESVTNDVKASPRIQGRKKATSCQRDEDSLQMKSEATDKLRRLSHKTEEMPYPA